MTPSIPGDPSLTEAAASARLHGYLADTLRHLPPGTSLSWHHPLSPGAVFGAAVIPCSDDRTLPDIPLKLNTDYWVLGAPAARTAECFGLIVAGWRAAGWQPELDDQEPPIQIAYARTPDGYGFQVLDNGEGDLSISASSPCFPPDNVGDGVLAPDISHPGDPNVVE